MQGTLKIKEIKDGRIGELFLRGTVEGTLKVGMLAQVGDLSFVIYRLYLYKDTFLLSDMRKQIAESDLKSGEYVDVHFMVRNNNFVEIMYSLFFSSPYSGVFSSGMDVVFVEAPLTLREKLTLKVDTINHMAMRFGLIVPGIVAVVGALYLLFHYYS